MGWVDRQNMVPDAESSARSVLDAILPFREELAAEIRLTEALLDHLDNAVSSEKREDFEANMLHASEEAVRLRDAIKKVARKKSKPEGQAADEALDPLRDVLRELREIAEER